MFSNCQGYTSQSNMSVNAYSSSQYGAATPSSNYGGHSKGNFLTSCMQAVCGNDPSLSTSRKYSTTMEDTSSIAALTHHNLNFEDECRITMSRFNKRMNGREILFIKAKATLMDDEVDEAHDLFYLVKMPETS